MSNAVKVKNLFAAERRLTSLRLLRESGGRANTSVIEKGLRLYAVPNADRATVNSDARWLAAAGLIIADELHPDLIAVILTDRGERVAKGEEYVEGVARPSAD